MTAASRRRKPVPSSSGWILIYNVGDKPCTVQHSGTKVDLQPYQGGTWKKDKVHEVVEMPARHHEGTPRTYRTSREVWTKVSDEDSDDFVAEVPGNFARFLKRFKAHADSRTWRGQAMDEFAPLNVVTHEEWTDKVVTEASEKEARLRAKFEAEKAQYEKEIAKQLSELEVLRAEGRREARKGKSTKAS